MVYNISMKRQLWKEGLRRCYVCTEIKSLDRANFATKRSGPKGFGYLCKPCKNRQRREKYMLVNSSTPRSERKTPQLPANLRGQATGSVAKQKIKIMMGLKCKHCDREHDNPAFFDIDHIIPSHANLIPRSQRWAQSQIPNYQVLCPSCHRIKTIQDKIDYPYTTKKRTAEEIS